MDRRIPKKAEFLKKRLRQNPSPSKRYIPDTTASSRTPVVMLDRSEINTSLRKRKRRSSSSSFGLPQESKPKKYNLKFNVRPATSALENYQRKTHSTKMQWVQKPKMIQLRDKGELPELSCNFLQLLNEHDSFVDATLEQQSELIIRQLGMATHIPASYRIATEFDKIQFQMNGIMKAEGKNITFFRFLYLLI